ncbi:ABC transporter substrate-binding protein [Erwinia sp. 198]|uniref:ABC transporter substrate-binding protein n=1 Tax=Erwinia sp. 198 TaxID=2022746 RepID=UPI000F6747B5|nr:ABC transporter substrate-binding protein [Erwinia sp. 198]RRZ95521.1 ABC transporter substrate-binding protein [Erwinia sp. 198]
MKNLIILMALAISGSACADGVTTLRIADQKGNMRAQLEASGLLKNLPFNIEWAEFPSAAPLAEALNAGAVDAGIIGDAPLLFSIAAGSQVKAIAVDKSDPIGTAIVVNKDSTLHGVVDLKGKSIGTGRGSIGHFVALKALAQAGIKAEDVHFRYLTPGDAKIALASGAIDAWATWDPYTALAETSGSGRVLVNGQQLIAGNSFLAATNSALGNAEKRQALQHYVTLLARAEQLAYANIDGYSATLANIIGFPQQAVKLSFSRRKAHWQAIDPQTVAQQQATADFYQQQGLIARPLQVEPTFYRGITIDIGQR